jgi:hypothetical protein
MSPETLVERIHEESAVNTDYRLLRTESPTPPGAAIESGRTRFVWLERAEGAPVLARLLAQDGGSRLTATESRSDGFERAASRSFDFVVLSEADDDEAAEQLVRDLVRAAPASPLVVLLATGTPESALRLVRAGAQRCLDGSKLGARELAALFHRALWGGVPGDRPPAACQGGPLSPPAGGVA